MGKKRPVLRSQQGLDLVLLAGLPRDTLKLVRDTLMDESRRRPAQYDGAPSPPNNWSNLYPQDTIKETLTLAGACVRKDKRTTTHAGLPTPRRIFLLYVPSRDTENLLAILGLVCYSIPLLPNENEWMHDDGSPIGWRHDRDIVEKIVYRALDKAIEATNDLKKEITDKRISILGLPAQNFYYPDKVSTIESVYREFVRGNHSLEWATDKLLPRRFTKDQLHKKAFKKPKQYTGYFFQDCRGRVFPPDPYDARSRAVESEDCEPLDALSEVLLVLRQRYRFGVTVRDGELHYDVQYERPKQLKREEMYCARAGDVWVTGSHINVGVNDVIWPPGRKELRI